MMKKRENQIFHGVAPAFCCFNQQNDSADSQTKFCTEVRRVLQLLIFSQIAAEQNLNPQVNPLE